MSPPELSVVICAFDSARAEALAEAVSSVREQAAETIVVVDHAPDLLAHARRALPGALVIGNAEARGLAGARNTGVRAARRPVVAFLDDDAVAAPGWASQLARHYADPQVVGAGGAIVPRWARARPGWFPEEFDWVVGCSYRGLPQAVAPVRNLIGCNMSFRREHVLAVGGFAEGLGRIGRTPVGCEETELCLRLAECGRLVYDPQAVVHHRVTLERATLAYFLARCYGEGRSKRAVVRRSGRQRGLESERAHLRRALPAGVGRGVRSAARGEAAGLARAGAIALGVAAAGAGYASGARA
jgi:glycosyltransferase involved in cell wall biosynthesis